MIWFRTDSLWSDVTYMLSTQGYIDNIVVIQYISFGYTEMRWPIEFKIGEETKK